jgi:hypothetical protein
MPISVFATLGDVLYVCGAVVVLSLVYKTSLLRASPLARRTYAVLGVVGLVIALFVEYKALYFGRWEYNALMPVTPFLKVGLSPIVQMTVLLPLSVYVSRAILKTYA